jgi:hypothetical protein
MLAVPQCDDCHYNYTAAAAAGQPQQRLCPSVAQAAHHMTAGNPMDHNHVHVQIHQSIHTAIHVWTASLLHFRPEQPTDCL